MSRNKVCRTRSKSGVIDAHSSVGPLNRMAFGRPFRKHCRRFHLETKVKTILEVSERLMPTLWRLMLFRNRLASSSIKPTAKMNS